MLQCQNTWPTKSGGVGFDENSRRNTRHGILEENSIVAKLLKAVLRDVNIASQHKRLHATQDFAHAAGRPSSGSRPAPLATFSPQAGRRKKKDYSAASIRFFPARRASFRAITGFRNCPV